MKKILMPLFATLMVAGSSPSWAWTDVTGTVVAVIPSYKMVQLDNGQTYMLEPDVSIAGVKVGDNVTLTTELQSNKNIVNRVNKEGE